MKTLILFCPRVAVWATTALLLVCVSASAGPRPHYQLTDLSAQPGAIRPSVPYAINDLGQIVGMAADSTGLGRPFVFRDGTVSDPGTATGWGEAVAINNAGQILTHEFVGSELRSFLIGDGVMFDLSAQAGQWTSASSLNTAGVVVGVSSTGGIQGVQYYGFSWSNGVFSALNAPAGAQTPIALDINRRGVIAGQLTVPAFSLMLDGFRAAIFLDGEGTILGLPKGAVGSSARAINDFGDVAGDAYYKPDADGGSRAFMSVRGRMRDIGVLPSDLISNATDINNSRQVVGISQDLVNEPRAFLYCGGNLYDLNDLVKCAKGWHFRTANAINNRGQIVGEALVEGGSRAYLLTPIGRSKD